MSDKDVNQQLVELRKFFKESLKDLLSGKLTDVEKEAIYDEVDKRSNDLLSPLEGGDER